MSVLGFPSLHLPFKHEIKNENWKQQLYSGDCAPRMIFPFIGKDVMQLWETCEIHTGSFKHFSGLAVNS